MVLPPRTAPSPDELFELVQRIAQLGVWQWDVRNDSVSWSHGLYRIYGVEADGFDGSFEAYLERVHPDDRERVTQEVRKTLENRGTFRFSERIVRPDGSVRVLESVGTVLVDAEDRPVQMVGACVDATERRALEQELALSERLSAVGTLATGIAHELNNPLLYLRAGLERLAELVEPPGPELEVLLADMLQGVDRMAEVVRGLRAQVRPEATETPPVRLAALVRNAVSMADHELRHRARVLLDLDDDVYVQDDGAQLGRVLLNLLANAADAIPAGQARDHEVRLSLRRDAGEAVFEVRDTGTGIAEAHLQRVFDPFFTTKPVGQGTGLGLFLAHRIVSALGGRIELSRATPRGTLAEVRLPLARPPTRPLALSPRALDRRCRVLVVDDDRLVGRGLRRLLHDHDTVHVLSAAEARAHLSVDRAFDVVLCDLMMPDGMGHELYAELEETHPELARRTVFITGGASTPEAQAFAQAQRERLLEKPFTRADLLAMLATVVSRQGRRASLAARR